MKMGDKWLLSISQDQQLSNLNKKIHLKFKADYATYINLEKSAEKLGRLCEPLISQHQNK